ncbi:hypothetical protein JMJ77_0001892 [Colletotrichum scovillei]|uniref:Uncharacterized protein n=1 Tax=Colletotrichum scovillei TaxID=1209932 RepID=A0A9P7R6U8_9PEZI|nr:hypothetical protein JMJ77_0001892 [Colletotrichum scovillei]KAG7070303.1 hypothetical protein JMJ76_0001558 [Colletotrichum scovillei]KAG7078554.1 hypothetical protein JMJ78_0002224 [Colletotrichum scovillei]
MQQSPAHPMGESRKQFPRAFTCQTKRCASRWCVPEFWDVCSTTLHRIYELEDFYFESLGFENSSRVSTPAL